MEDRDVIRHIDDLVAEEHRLRSSGHELSEGDQGRLHDIEVHLDQAWDLLRQRRALRDAGADPDAAGERPVDEVESYLQ